jgi:hypothetical protein
MIKWKDIESYGYQVSEDGQIRSKERYVKNSNYGTVRLVPEHILKQEISNSGYKSITILVNNKRKHFYIHQLVANSFVDNPNGYKIINHLDGNKDNNHYTNLEFTTSSSNNQHAYDIGLKARGEDASYSKLTIEDVKSIRMLHEQGYGKNRIKRILNLPVSTGAIQQVYSYVT